MDPTIKKKLPEQTVRVISRSNEMDKNEEKAHGEERTI